MANKKNSRTSIIIECIECRTSIIKRKFGVSRYLTLKNKKNNPEKLEIKKFCKYCNKRTIHKEIK